MVFRHCLTILFAAGLGLPVTAGAAVITVNSTADLPDANLYDGVCDADLAQPGEQRTLRAAVQHANVTAGADQIVLPAGKYKLKIKGSVENQAATGDLDILDDLTITGAGAANTVVDGKKANDRIFDVLPGVTVTIEELTIRNGRASKSETGGGAIRNLANLAVRNAVISKCRSKDDAGAIDQQQGTSTISGVLFSGNRANDDGGAIDVDGGTMVISATTFQKNRAKDEGGALENSGNDVDLVNVTFSGNSAKHEGGAISIEDGGTMTLMCCTFAENKAKKAYGVSANDQAYGLNTVTVQNTIFADHRKKECSGTLISTGGNLDIGKSCGFGAGDLSNTDPKLLKLKKNGAPTPTHALKSSSPAIDAGNDVGCPALDQRGNPRVDMPGVGTATTDIGAFEYQGP